MAEIKFCKDCRYYEYKEITNYNGDLVGLSARCLKTKRINSPDLVSGNHSYSILECWQCRTILNDIACGPEAKYFEPRKSFWQRVKEWVR